MLDSKGFDIWSEEYDEYVQRSSIGYPFEGYYDVLNEIYKLVERKESIKILDVGFGTGLLTNQLYKDGANIYGIDFSQKMIEIAQAKMPEAKFIQWDFNFGLPAELEMERFDYILSSYAIHHLDDNKKVQFIKKLKSVLNEDGKILIGDIAFNTKEELLRCNYESGDNWDSNEIYIVADEIIKALMKEKITAEYKQISPCAGVLEIFNDSNS